MVASTWLRSWRVLLVLAAVEVLVLGGYAIHGLIIGAARGIPAAGLVMVGVGAIGIAVIAAVAALLLRAGRAPRAVSATMVVLGVVALLLDPVRPELTTSGIVGTTFAVVLIVGGGLGLYQASAESA